ncbi:hypothetical protein OGZ01_07915 [Vibrio harveyi]|nr:hypothetical protein [Vibrio harveyi]
MRHNLALVRRQPEQHRVQAWFRSVSNPPTSLVVMASYQLHEQTEEKQDLSPKQVASAMK